MRIKRNIHWVALFVGILAAFVEGISNIEDISHKVGTLYDPGVFAAAVTSIGAAVLLAFTIKAFQQRHFLVGVGLVLTLLFTAGYTISTTLTRTAETRQKALTKTFESDAQWKQLFNVYKQTSDRQASECGMGAGPKCLNNSTAAILALGAMKKRQDELDAMGQQVKWMFALVKVEMDVDTAGRIQPMFLPIALFLLGMMCIAFGENGEWVNPEFDTKLIGREAVEDKVRRYIEAYKSANGGSPPPISQVQKVADIKEWQARTLVKKFA